VAGNAKHGGAFALAQPCSGDLVDQLLEASLRAALFGAQVETRLGRLHVERCLGSGGMGEILLAFDPVLDRRVAVKMLRTERSKDTEALLREARVLAKLDHPNVVAIHDVVEADGALYLVMDHVDGGNLRDWIGAGRPWREVVDVFVQIGDGLAAAHVLDIAHCDVKPENVLMSNGRPRLIDFGLAHALHERPSYGGTRAYLAPERIGGGAGSPAADQYAFFSALVEAIEGRRPAHGDAWQGMPGWLAAVARRGLHDSPRARFADMRAAVAALRGPRRRRTIALAAGLIVATAAGAGATMTLRGDGDNQRVCAGAADQVARRWTPATRASISRSFAAAGVDGAEAIARSVTERLDAYVTEWGEARTRSCKATRVYGEQPEHLLGQSMHCFDQKLLSFQSVVELFTDAPTPAVVNGAHRIAARLENVRACLDPAHLTGAARVPEDPVARRRVLTLQARYEQVRKLDRRGEHAPALELTDQLVVDAQELRYAPLTASILVTRAALQHTLGDSAHAEQSFNEAASAAARAQDNDKLAEIWIRKLELLAQQNRYDEALAMEPVAVTSAERVPDNLEIQARMYNALGGIYLATSRYDDAHRVYEKALQTTRKIDDVRTDVLVPAIGNLGLAKWYRGDLQGARRSMQEAFDLALPAFGADHSLVAYVRKNIADLQVQLGELDQAEPHYLEVLRIWKASLGPDHPNLAYAYESLAHIAKERGDLDAALAHADMALRLRERHHGAQHALVLQALSVVAEVHAARRGPASEAAAERAIERALAIYDALGAPAQRQAVYVLKTRAKLAERRRRWRDALRDRRQVLAIQLEATGKKHPDTAYAFVDVASVHTQLGNLAAAEENLLAAQEILDAHPDARPGDAIEIRQDRAALLAKRDHHRAAADLLREAIARAQAIESAALLASLQMDLAIELHAAGDRTEAVGMARALEERLSGSPGDPQLRAVAERARSWLAGRARPLGQRVH
jgi:eukaryotic-like serine/threonine-protein kinase